MSTEYKLIYPLSGDSIFQIESVWLILIIALYLVAYFIFKKRTYFFGFIFLILVFSLFNYYPYIRSNNINLKKNNLIIEGQVEKLIPIDKEGKGYESFCIKTQCFYYSNFNNTGGFNKTQLNGSSIRNGMFLKVTYQFIDSSTAIILRIEQRE
jgi:hypothetical protein